MIKPIVILGEFEQVTKKETVPDLLPVSLAIHSHVQCSSYLQFFHIIWKTHRSIRLTLLFVFFFFHFWLLAFKNFCFVLIFSFCFLKWALNCPCDSHCIYSSEPYVVSNELGGKRCWNGEKSTRIQDNEIFTLWGKKKKNGTFGNSLLLVPYFLKAELLGITAVSE